MSCISHPIETRTTPLGSVLADPASQHQMNLRPFTVVDTNALSGGPTITTYKETHPVNVVTVVSAVMIPSFEGIDHVGVLAVN